MGRKALLLLESSSLLEAIVESSAGGLLPSEVTVEDRLSKLNCLLGVLMTHKQPASKTRALLKLAVL